MCSLGCSCSEEDMYYFMSIHNAFDGLTNSRAKNASAAFFVIVRKQAQGEVMLPKFGSIKTCILNFYCRNRPLESQRLTCSGSKKG